MDKKIVKIKIDIGRARYAQTLISKKAIEKDEFSKPIRTVGGVDVAFYKGYSIGSAVSLKFDSMEIIDKAYYICPVKVAYIPTYLAFREISAMIGAVKNLKMMPDIILVDAHGKLHPRRAGEATHLGVVLNIPTIGVAKSYLMGRVRDDHYIVDNGEILGYQLSPEVYISVGHRVSLDTAIDIVKRLMLYNIPEPTRLAHNYASEIKRRIHKFISRGVKYGGFTSIDLP